MSLHGAGLRVCAQMKGQFPPSSGQMPSAGQEITYCLAIGVYSRFGIGIELALSWLSEGQPGTGETDSAANQFGAHGRERRKPARHTSVVCGSWLPLA
jgi:hypothetical protein